MDLIQQKSPLRTRSAKTSDWIWRFKGGIYAYDLSALVAQGTVNIDFNKEDFKQALNRVGRQVEPKQEEL